MRVVVVLYPLEGLTSPCAGLTLPGEDSGLVGMTEQVLTKLASPRDAHYVPVRGLPVWGVAEYMLYVS